MDYDAFKDSWVAALGGSRLVVFGAEPVQETLELSSLERQVVSVLWLQPARDPFTITAKLSWRWRALHTARTATSEEDMLTELLGREDTGRTRTARPWLRLDIALRASLPWGQPLAMPAKPAWATWRRDVMDTFDTRAPLIPSDRVRSTRRGELEILGTISEPEAEVASTHDGDLKVTALSIEAWQAIELARKWSDSSRRPDTGVREQLEAMFARVHTALRAWSELMIHFGDAN